MFNMVSACHRQIRCVNGQLICRANEMTSADKMLFRLIRWPSYLTGQIRWQSYLTEADKLTYEIQAKAGQTCHFLLLGHCQIRQFEWRVVVYAKTKTCRRVAFHFWRTSKLCTKTNQERPLPHITEVLLLGIKLGSTGPSDASAPMPIPRFVSINLSYFPFATVITTLPKSLSETSHSAKSPHPCRQMRWPTFAVSKEDQ